MTRRFSQSPVKIGQTMYVSAEGTSWPTANVIKHIVTEIEAPKRIRDPESETGWSYSYAYNCEPSE